LKTGSSGADLLVGTDGGRASKLRDYVSVRREEDLGAMAHVGDLQRVTLLVEHERGEAVAQVVWHGSGSEIARLTEEIETKR
jgi:hypothetical protein